MALPVVKNALECAEYTNTVHPYLYQLRPLPGIVAESITNAAALRQVYLDTNPLITSIAFSIAIAPIFLVVSEINKNYSQVDRMWSILPSIHHLHHFIYAYLAGYDTTRIGGVALASVIWSTRLTYNYWRRGGYSVGSEDYRWALVKDYVGPTVMFLFNVTFISLAQSLLLCAITTPAYVMLLSERLVAARALPAWTTGDTCAFGLIVTLIALTAIGDQQQWNYQNAKHAYRKTGVLPANSKYTKHELEVGFPTKGFFAYARKPNYATEQAVWGSFYLWSCITSGTLYNWTGIGFLSYLILFQASTWLTELLSEQKYPEYAQYRRQVGQFIPTSLSPPRIDLLKSKAAIENGAAVGKKNDVDAAHARERYNLRGSP
jgi:steroid 5-alpha reductase family enzyme